MSRPRAMVMMQGQVSGESGSNQIRGRFRRPQKKRHDLVSVLTFIKHFQGHPEMRELCEVTFWF